MALYLRELAKYYPTDLPGEASLAGWVDADMFVTGLRMVGRDHLTRTRLIDALNSLTAFTADGIVAPIDWHYEHRSVGPVDCNVYVRAIGGHFVPLLRLGRDGLHLLRGPPAGPGQKRRRDPTA